MFQKSFYCLFFLACFVHLQAAFQIGDPVKVMANKVSPFANPSQSYKYYALPLCFPKNISTYPLTLGEKLTGNGRSDSVYIMNFGVNSKNNVACNVLLNERQIKVLRAAVRQNFIFELFIEDISVGNAFGYVQGNQTILNSHLNFHIYYNRQEGKIIQAHVGFERDHGVDITDGEQKTVLYTYSVTWTETSASSRLPDMGVNTFFSNESHEFAYLNGVVLNVSILGLVWAFLKKMHKSEGEYLPLENGIGKTDFYPNWKYMKQEISLSPSFSNLMAAVLANGVQLIFTTLSLLILGSFGLFNHSRGSVLVTGIVTYITSSVFSGLFLGKFSGAFGEKKIVRKSLLTTFLFTLPTLIITAVLSLAIPDRGYIVGLSAGTLLLFAAILIFVILPLNILGAMMKEGKDTAKEHHNFPKMYISGSNTWTTTISMALLGGLLPFSSLHFDLYYIFASIWARKIFTVYSSFFAVFIFTLSITALTSILMVHFQLEKRDSQWHWKSFFYGGTCGLYVLLYSIYFYLTQSHLTGLVQLLYYFCYSTLFAFATTMIYGTVGFLSASAFIKYLSERKKVE